MSPGSSYETVVDGCGKKPVKFFIIGKLAHAEDGASGRKAEVAMTGQGNLLGRKVAYGADSTKVEQYKKFKDINAVGTWFSKEHAEEAKVLTQLKVFAEGKQKLPTFDV